MKLAKEDRSSTIFEGFDSFKTNSYGLLTVQLLQTLSFNFKPNVALFKHNLYSNDVNKVFDFKFVHKLFLGNNKPIYFRPYPKTLC